MKLFKNIYVALLVFLFSILIFLFALYQYCLSSVSKDETIKSIVIEPGSTVDGIASILVDDSLIRSKFVFKVYVKLNNKNNLKAGTFSLSESMSLKEIVDVLEKGNNSCTGEYKITFKEGLNMRSIASVIAENTDNSIDDVYAVLNDKEYLKGLIDEYWFLSDSILNDNIYYSLEGYLYPNTYYFCDKDVEVEEIFESMLDEMEKQLKEYRDEINSNDRSFHELLTIASIAELEGVTLEDRKGIAGVLYNRLLKKMSLGCDVTTYYGARIDMGDRDLYVSELNECNGYNTRCSTFKGLPISPISNPSIDSIVSAINPDNNDYYYFVADKNRKIYFSKTLNEHNNTIARLKKQNLWYEY